MKAMKKLIPAICLLLISAVLLGTSTYAWFSMNTKVEATGMQVSAKAGPSLVIFKDKFVSGQSTVGIAADGIPKLYPATQLVAGSTDKSAASTTITSTTGLVAVNNGGAVDPNTGLAKDPTTNPLYYDAVAAADACVIKNESSTIKVTPGYYFDYTVYLAVDGEDALTDGTLKIDVKPLSGLDSNEVILKATSIGVIVGDTTVAADNTNLEFAKVVHLDKGTMVDDSTQGAIDLIAVDGTVIIPIGKVGESTGLKITLRIYIDGALLADGSTTETYVKNKSIIDLTRNATFSVSFTYEANETTGA